LTYKYLLWVAAFARNGGNKMVFQKACKTILANFLGDALRLL